MINLIVLGMSCVSEQSMWYCLPQTVTFHQWIDFIFSPISHASACILSRCSFWAHLSNIPASFSHSRILFWYLVLVNLLPSLPYPLLKTQVLIWIWEFRAWWAPLSLNICWVLDGLIRLLIQMHPEGKRISNIWFLSISFKASPVGFCAPAHHFWMFWK